MFHFIYQSIKHDLAMQLAVAFGVIIAAAVLTGALLVGDSMRGSLRDLTLDRLGPVDYVMTGDNFVREEIAQEITDDPTNPFQAAALIMLPAGAKYEDRTTGVTLLGCSDDFWDFFTPPGGKPSTWSRDQVVINQALADILGIAEKGETVISLWVSKPELIPADSSLGRREETRFR
ncbi:MAG: hypothetical protein FWC43_10715, partial [Planctomycetaceae bacterium]|nr:hypothetical protein [Planctomycetaceae bacterium]